MNLLLFPLLLQIGKAGNTKINPQIVKGLAKRKIDPTTINSIIFQYRMWAYILELENYCYSCGTTLSPESKSTTDTCSPRCHKVVKRSEMAPMEFLKKEALKRMKIVEEFSKKPSDENTNEFPWHLVNDGWKYALHN